MLTNMQFYGYHGLLPEENKLGQRFNVDIELFTNLKKPAQTDNMNDSIHYGHVYELVKEIAEGEAMNLIEAVAGTIADELLVSFELLSACMVRVTKPDPPVPGHYQSIAVEIFREKPL